MTYKLFGGILRSYSYHYYRNIRFISTSTKENRYCKRTDLVQHEKSSYRDEEAKRIRFYFLRRYLQYIKSSNKIIEQRFPTAIRTYRVFKDGLKEFYSDLKQFVRIVRLLNTPGNSLKNLTRKEIELYYQMPKDMIKVAPILILSALPLTNYFVFPLIYLFPRQLLTSHFWNLQQKSEFNVIILKERLMYNRPVFRHVQAQLDSLEGHPVQRYWKNILAMLGSGVQPSVAKILMCKELFEDKPYELNCLQRKHVKDLLQMHGLGVGIFRRTARLRNHAKILLAMDKATMREGGVHNLPTDALRKACLVRGLNPSNMSNDELITWLKKWMDISKEIDDSNLSLLLHSPVLLAYNEQSNWTLIYLKK